MKHLIKNWMTKDPKKIDVNKDIDIAKEIFLEEFIRHLLVTDQGELVGVLTQHDLEAVEKIKSKFQGVDCLNIKITAGDLMGRSPVKIDGDSSMDEAMRIMDQRHFHSLVVVDNAGETAGILTSTDVMKYALVCLKQSESYNASVREG